MKGFSKQERHFFFYLWQNQIPRTWVASEPRRLVKKRDSWYGNVSRLYMLEDGAISSDLVTCRAPVIYANRMLHQSTSSDPHTHKQWASVFPFKESER